MQARSLQLVRLRRDDEGEIREGSNLSESKVQNFEEISAGRDAHLLRTAFGAVQVSSRDQKSLAMI